MYFPIFNLHILQSIHDILSYKGLITYTAKITNNAILDTTKAKIPNAVTSFIPNTSHTPLQNFLSKSTFNAAKKPLSTLGKGFWAAGIPMGVNYSYNAGRESVEDQVRQDSAALADMQAINLFNTPGFTGGLGRLLAALAPSIVGGGINDAAGNILGTNQAPQTGQQVQSLYTD